MAKIYGDEKGDKFQWDKLKGEPLKVKLDYIITYYGIAIAVTVVLIIMAVSITVSVIKNSVPRVISGEVYTYETDELPTEELMTYLCEKLGLAEEDYTIDVYASALNLNDYEQYSTQLQKIAARITAGDLDFLIAESGILTTFMNTEGVDYGAFQDLSEVLPADLYEKLVADDRIIYFEADDGTIPYAISLNDTKLAEFLNLPLLEYHLAMAMNAPMPEAFIAMVEMIYE